MSGTEFLLPLLSLAAIDIVTICIPGPNTILVIQAAMTGNARSANWIGVGLATASAIWAGIALTGLSIAYAEAPQLQISMRIAGAIYVLWLGLKISRVSTTKQIEYSTIPIVDSAAFATGLFTGLLNPKVFVYFGSVFLVILPADIPLLVKIAMVFIVILDGLLVYRLMTHALSNQRTRKLYSSWGHIVNKLAAALLVVSACRMLWFG